MDERRTPSSRPPNPNLPYREDCWSEGETSVLIEAWGDRYVDLNRGNLRQKQWQEVADAVNSRPCDARRPPRTDVQCKNRIDTLKKKYKAERSKIADGAISSQWIFYDRLELLIGAFVPPKKQHLHQPRPLAMSPPLALPLPAHRKGIPLPTASAVRPLEMEKKRQMAIVPVMQQQQQDPFFRHNYSPVGAVAAVADDDDSDSESSRSSEMYRKRARPVSKERSGKGLRKGREGGTEEDGIRELSKAIERMAEIYERVEVEKQRQMMELDKQRMEFAKSLEFQRMQMFVDTQVQLMKMKQAKRDGSK